ncbi:MAG: hypothetical protein SFT93_02800 [Rickettsiaceae bacterium]|nr:hypothetical protein [Rickettsiaceae bacterium]
MKKSPKSRKLFYKYFPGVVVFLFAVFGIFYSLSLYSIHLFWNAAKHTFVDENNRIFLPHKTYISFAKKSYNISSQFIGIEFSGAEYHGKKDMKISMEKPVYLGFNPWTFSLVLFYNGTGQIVTKKESIDFKLDTEHKIKTRLDSVILRKIFAKPYRILNYIEEIKLNFYEFSAVSKSGKISDIHETSITIKPNQTPEYTSFAEILDNLPKSLRINIASNITNYSYSPALHGGLIKASDHNENIYGTINLDIHSKKDQLSYKNILQDAVMRCSFENFSDDNISINGVGEFDFTDNRKFIDINYNFALKNNFVKFLIKEFTKIKNKSFLTLYLTDQETVDFSKEIIQLISQKKFNLELNTNYIIDNDNLSCNLKNFSLVTESRSGFGTKGSFEIQNNLNGNLNLDLILLSARSASDYWTEVIMKYIWDVQDLDKSLIHLAQDLNYNFLKKISDYPNSSSRDMRFRIVYKDHEIGVSGNNFQSIRDRYFQEKTSLILNHMKSRHVPEEILRKFAPEATEILKELVPNKTNQRIKEELWQKLIK